MSTEQINKDILSQDTNETVSVVQNETCLIDNEQNSNDIANDKHGEESSVTTIEEQIIIPETSTVLDNDDSLSDQLHEYQTEIARLNSIIQSQINEIDQLNSKLVHQDQTYQQLISKLKDDNLKEKQAQVVKYAQSEKRTLDLDKRYEQLIQKQNELQRDKDSFQQKLQESKTLNIRIQQAYDLKLSEISQMKKDQDKLRELSQSIDQTLKSTLAHLKQETQQLKEQKDLNERLKREYIEQKEVNEQLRKQYKELAELQQEVTQNIVPSSGDDVLASNNDLVDDATKQILDRCRNLELQVNEKVQQCDQLTCEQNQSKLKLTNLIEENSLLRSKMKLLEEDKLSLENVLEKDHLNMKKEKESNKKIYDDLLKLREQDCEELAKLKLIEHDYIELKDDYEQYRNKKSELLEFTQKLTELNSTIQSDYEQLTLKHQSIEKQYVEISQLYREQQTKMIELEKELQTVKQNYDELNLKYTELFNKYDVCTRQYEDEKIENQTLKKKHQANVKDLIKQLQQLQKKSSDTTPSPTT
ncbi:unnamed protein product, partial [Didymodactylos carnosus]